MIVDHIRVKSFNYSLESGIKSQLRENHKCLKIEMLFN